MQYIFGKLWLPFDMSKADMYFALLKMSVLWGKKSNCFARHCKLSLLTYPLDDKPFWSKLFGPKENIQPGAEVGKANGLTVLLDAETYDYTYHLRAGEGFKVNAHLNVYIRLHVCLSFRPSIRT